MTPDLWIVPDELQEETQFQATAIRDILAKHRIDQNFFDLCAFKSLMLLKRMLFNEKDLDITDILCAQVMTKDLEDVFEEFLVAINEEENLKGE